MKAVIGNNLMALVAAISLKRESNRDRVALINFSKKLGGNSQSFLFNGHFIDVGMQTFFRKWCFLG